MKPHSNAAPGAGTFPVANASSPTNDAGDKLAWLHGTQRPWWKRVSTWLALVAIVAAWWGWTAWRDARAVKAAPVYVTAPVTRGDIALTVAANGTLQPTRTVSIGSELSGTVAAVRADVNDTVKAGQVLVELDKTKLAAQYTRSQATLASARAAVTQAGATVAEARNTLGRLEEVKRISGGKLPAATELDAAKAALLRAQANEAAARAGVTEAQATVDTDRTNLDKASIRAPIDGVILTRSVEPGQAVAASLQAVTLFTMAESLSTLKLAVAVDEADVGQVKAGQNASFTVSAWPGRRYPATIRRVAYASTITENVVTYSAELEVANQDLSLRPGMTANATIAATEHKAVLTVPTTALTFVPTTAAGSAPQPAASGSGGSIVDKLVPRMPRPTSQRRGGSERDGGAGGQRQVWVLEAGQPVMRGVTAGLSNGRQVEVAGDGIAEGTPVIVEQRSAAAKP